MEGFLFLSRSLSLSLFFSFASEDIRDEDVFDDFAVLLPIRSVLLCAPEKRKRRREKERREKERREKERKREREREKERKRKREKM